MIVALKVVYSTGSNYSNIKREPFMNKKFLFQPFHSTLNPVLPYGNLPKQLLTPEGGFLKQGVKVKAETSILYELYQLKSNT